MQEADVLVEDDVPPIEEPEGRERGLHLPEVAVRVRAPNVDLLVEAALDEGLAVVGDVDPQVGRVPVAAHDDAIDVLAELFRLQPDRAVVLLDGPGASQRLEGLEEVARGS